MHPVRHAGILLTVAVVSEAEDRGEREYHSLIVTEHRPPERHAHSAGDTYESADLCCEEYLLGEYMLPSLLEGPMLF